MNNRTKITLNFKEIGKSYEIPFERTVTSHYQGNNSDPDHTNTEITISLHDIFETLQFNNAEELKAYVESHLHFYQNTYRNYTDNQEEGNQ